MPCLHKEAPSSLHVEPRRRSQVLKSGLEKKEKFREKSACVKRKDGEKNQGFISSTGWIFSTLWTPGATSQKLGFRLGKENERVKVWLDDHHIRRSSRYWVSDSESFQEVQALQTGPKSRIPFLGRRVSHPVCKPCWRHFHPFALEKPHSCLSTRRFADSEFLNPSCLKCHPHFLSSQRPVEYCERGESCDLILRLFDINTNAQNNIKHLQVLQHFCEILQAQLCCLCLTTTNENGLKSLGPALLTSACTQPEWWRSVMKHVISTGQTLNIRDCYKDPRFQSEIYEKEEVQRPCSILCLPVLNHKTEVLGVVLAVGKSRLDTSGCSFFSEQDEKVLSSHMALLGLILENRQLWENSEQECKRNQVLMELAQMVSHDFLVLDTMLSKLARIILPVSKAEFCKVFFSEDSSMGLFTRMVYIEQQNTGPFVEYSRDCDPKDISYIYAVRVRNSQETLNIANSHTNNSEVSPIRSLICTPLKDKQSSNIIGVCQLGNKRCESMTDTEVFSQSDEQLLKDFAVYCGLGIQKCTTQRTADKTSARLAVTKEVLSYQITASQEDIHALEEATIPSAQSLHLRNFAFSDFEMSQTSMTQAVLRMFLDLNLLQEFSIDYKTLCQWVLSVRRGYRDTVAYHNWSHAIRTAQCMFAMVQTSDLKGCFSHLEVLALMIASLSHDLDHRGLNNSYIERSKQPLAQLYGHSSLEHHHFDLCLLILNNPGSQILASLSRQEYRSCVQMIEKNILSTDLAAYLEKRTTFFKLAQNNNCQWMDEQHKELLRSMLMTASDICAITKPWLVQKRIAELVAAEFFAQGDKEKCELDFEPAGLMDRRNATQLPQMQVDYIDGICAPLFEALAGIFESCSPLIEGCRENRKNWQRLAKEEATCRGMESFN